jgi:hypothetical protein
MDAKSVVSEQVQKLTDKLGSKTGTGEWSQTVTIERPRGEVEEFWRDSDRVSGLLHDAGQDIRVVEAGKLRVVGAQDSENAVDVEVSFADAPRDLGTEVTLRGRTPGVGLAAGAAAFTALYRARALLQTGEAPSLEHNPSARDNRPADAEEQ